MCKLYNVSIKYLSPFLVEPDVVLRGTQQANLSKFIRDHHGHRTNKKSISKTLKETAITIQNNDLYLRYLFVTTSYIFSHVLKEFTL